MLKIVTMTVEISDQYGTSESKLVGVFDNNTDMRIAIQEYENKYRERRTSVDIREVEINKQIDI